MFAKAIGFHPHRAASRGGSGGDLSSSVPKENPARVWGPSRGEVVMGISSCRTHPAHFLTAKASGCHQQSVRQRKAPRLL